MPKGRKREPANAEVEAPEAAATTAPEPTPPPEPTPAPEPMEPPVSAIDETEQAENEVQASAPEPEVDEEVLIAEAQLRIIEAAPQLASSPTLIGVACKKVLKEFPDASEDALVEQVLDRLNPPAPEPPAPQVRTQDFAQDVQPHYENAPAIPTTVPRHDRPNQNPNAQDAPPKYYFGRIDKPELVPHTYHDASGYPDQGLINAALNQYPDLRIPGVLKFEQPAPRYQHAMEHTPQSVAPNHTQGTNIPATPGLPNPKPPFGGNTNM